MYGDILETTIQKMNEMIDERKKNLPMKALKFGYPHIYWIALPSHRSFDGKTRSKFNYTLEAILKLQPNMRMALMKEHWAYDDGRLVLQPSGALTAAGRSAYWKGVDATMQFNIMKREQIFGYGQKYDGAKNNDSNPKDRMQNFFKKYKIDRTKKK